jgi:membrane-associated phospholipid phosphatase
MIGSNIYTVEGKYSSRTLLKRFARNYPILLFCFLLVLINPICIQAQLSYDYVEETEDQVSINYNNTENKEADKFYKNSDLIPPYQLSYARDSWYLGSGLSLSAFGYFLTKQIVPFTPAQILELNMKGISGFDQIATLNQSSYAEKSSDLLVFGSQALSGLFLLNKTTRNDFGKIAILYAEVQMINAGLTWIAKGSFQRPRPYIYNAKYENSKKLSRNSRMSFYSGHTSLAASSSFFAAKVFADYFPDSPLKPLVWVVAYTIPAMTAYYRVLAGKHYPSDVFVGYGVGAAIGFLVPHFHKKLIKNDKIQLSFNGGRLLLNF